MKSLYVIVRRIIQLTSEKTFSITIWFNSTSTYWLFHATPAPKLGQGDLKVTMT